MTEQKATNVVWHDGEVTRADRFNRLGQKGVTLWFTGLSGSGKSTVAVIRRIGEISKLYCDTGIITLNSFISPYREDRDQVRKLHADGGYNFIEVHVDCALECAEDRDPKGLYKKARAGEIKNFTGIDDPYEAPLNPEITLHTDKMTLEEEVEIILNYLQEQRFLILYR